MLTANQKYIDTANIRHLLGAGEKNADKIQIAVDRYYHQTDLSVCLFTLRAVNSGGGLIMQNLEKEITENQIILTWTITEDFTAVSGELLPEIVGQQDDTVVIKYEMTPMVVRNSILEQYKGGIDAIDKALREIQSILAQAEQLIAKMPIIKNDTWWIYDAATGNYQDSGQPAKGDKGDTGADGRDGNDGLSAYGAAIKNGFEGSETEWLVSLHGTKGDPGEPGKDGVNGADGKNGIDGSNGYSPTAAVTETETGAVITITDKNGTTTANIKNGIDGETISWGDFTPGWDGSTSAKYCTVKLVPVKGKQSWQVLPSISTVDHNGLEIAPDGLFVQDLSSDVNTLKTSAHTHTNKVLLERIQQNEQVHMHTNMTVLQAITQQQVNDWCEGYRRAVYNTEKVNQMQSSITVYVNATSGSDSNDGKTAETAFATLSKAISFTDCYKKTILYLAAGTYTIPDKTATWINKDIRIYGNTKEDTIIQGNIVAENSFLRLARVTVDSTDSETANVSANTITAQYGTILRMDSCIVNTAYNMCVNCTETSKSYLTNCTFSGALQYAVHTTGFGDVRIYQCSDNSEKGVRSGGGSVVYITNSSSSTEFPYINGNYGIVYVNGQQVLPQTAETAAILSMGGNV